MRIKEKILSEKMARDNRHESQGQQWLINRESSGLEAAMRCQTILLLKALTNRLSSN